MDSKNIIIIFLSILILFMCFGYNIYSNQQFQQQKQETNKTNNEVKLFYAPWCGWSKKILPEWDQASEQANGNVNMVKVDCHADRSACPSDIRGFPTIIKYSDGNQEEYKGNRTASDILTWAQQPIE